VPVRKIGQTIISSPPEPFGGRKNLIVLKIHALKISSFGQNDKEEGFHLIINHNNKF